MSSVLYVKKEKNLVPKIERTQNKVNTQNTHIQTQRQTIKFLYIHSIISLKGS